MASRSHIFTLPSGKLSRTNSETLIAVAPYSPKSIDHQWTQEDIHYELSSNNNSFVYQTLSRRSLRVGTDDASGVGWHPAVPTTLYHYGYRFTLASSSSLRSDSRGAGSGFSRCSSNNRIQYFVALDEQSTNQRVLSKMWRILVRRDFTASFQCHRRGMETSLTQRNHPVFHSRSAKTESSNTMHGSL